MPENIDQGLYFTQSGEANMNSDKPPVILLHGLFGMGRNLGGIARALSDQYAVFSFDLPNHGRSPHSDGMTITSMADAVLLMLDDLGLDTVHVLGHSLGGKVAMSLALRYPSRVNKMIVADIAPVTYPAKHDAILEALGAIDVQQATSRAEVQALLQATIKDKATSQFLMQNLEKGEQGFRWRMNLSAIINSYADLRQGLSLGASSLGASSLDASSLESDAIVHRVFEKPVLFISGENSSYMKPEFETVSRALFPNCEFTEIAGTGHWLHAEKPEAFNALVLDFFD